MSTKTAASWGGKSRFGFVANSGDRNVVGIAEKISVGYKGEFQHQNEIEYSEKW